MAPRIRSQPFLSLLILAAVLAAAFLPVASKAAEAGWSELFNGRDLAGWVNVNCAPNTFTVRDGMIISTGVPTGIMHTDRQYENFELELEYRHMRAGGNAGLFVWSEGITAPGTPFAKSIEVQILDGRNGENYTSHGDVFAIHGATFKPMHPHPGGWMRCLPSERRAKPPGEWNHYRVTCSNGVIRLAVNGKVVSGGSEAIYRKGYICLESEGSECHFRNLRLREWPSTNPKPEETAPVAEGFRPLYTGIDLSGWKVEPGHEGHWRTNDWILAYDGKSTAANKILWTKKEFGDFVLIADWRLIRKPETKKVPGSNDGGSGTVVEVQKAVQGGILLRGSGEARLDIGPPPIGVAGKLQVRPEMLLVKPVGEWNRFVITMRANRLTAELNGQSVTKNAPLSGVPLRGAIGLEHGGYPIQFANLLVRELE